MIERQNLIKEHQAGIRDAQIILRQLRQTFDLAHDVVGKESHRTRGKRRQPSNMRRLLPRQHFLEQGEDIALQGSDLASLVDGNRTPAGQDRAIGPDADKGIATHLFAAFHGFEEKGPRLIGGQAQKGGNWGFEVGRERAVDRNQAMRSRQLKEFRTGG